MSAKAAFAPFSGASAYINSKAAVATLMKCIATEYRKDGVRANVILPAMIDTPETGTPNPNPREPAGSIRSTSRRRSHICYRRLHLPSQVHKFLSLGRVSEHERTDDVEWRAAAGMKESQ